jgi:predicted methyltransferase
MRTAAALSSALAVACTLFATGPTNAATTADDAALNAAIAGKWRPEDQKARDQYRHPKESLEFWALKPHMSILEVQPGGGWWTEILAPYAHATGGKFYATAADLSSPKVSEEARADRERLEKHFAAHPEIYGKVTLVNWGIESSPLPASKFDFILTARSVHNWMNAGNAEKVFAQLYTAAKPGGILAVEQHRANPGNQDPKAESGYVTEATVIQLAEKAGFKLDGRSDINANSKDTKDHPFGVWTLPPTRATSNTETPDPNFDRTKYDAIGESDRMTLKFRKPGGK